MDLLRIIFSFSTVAGLGILFGIGLAVASKFLAVKRDERVEKIEKILPGVNCGACSYAGCASYAGAIIGANAALTLCSPGGEDVAQELAQVMGVEISFDVQKKVTQVHCRGGKDTAQYSFLYSGVKDCNSLYSLFRGNKVCKFGCLGMESCIKVCPTEAIYYNKQELVEVDKEKCISCGKCIEVCPSGVMQYVPYKADFIVACNSTDKGGKVRKYCKVGCIGCKICEKKSPEGGFTVDKFLARIDYAKKGEREQAAEACPPKCIIRN